MSHYVTETWVKPTVNAIKITLISDVDNGNWYSVKRSRIELDI
jgi:hypothetical protein